MTIKPSLLELKDFVVINFDYSFISPADQIDVQAVFAGYEVDIDFSLQKGQEHIYNVFVKAEINYDETKPKQPGYTMLVECVGVFSMDESLLSKEDGQNLLTNSALVMTLNFLRTFIADATGHFPFGKYWLPSMDMKELLAQKQQAIAKAEESKK